mgnify:CR=1 FL=1
MSMIKFFQKPYRWAIIYAIILSLSVTFVLLNTFVIPQAETKIDLTSDTQNSGNSSNLSDQSDATITDTSYKDDNIQITIDTVREYDTTVYIADIQVLDIKYLKAAFASSTYGRNIKDTTSNIAEDNNAILAINGDYYGFRDYGFVLRNGVLYRDTADTTGDEGSEALVIDSDGDFSIVDESQTDIQDLVDQNIWQMFSFGPTLINNGEISVTASSEVGKSMNSNPRTAIGQISALHYIFVVSDGRTSASSGLTLLELALIMYDKGCTLAYNLDGGGSSTIWFNGEVVNNPTTNGDTISERSVSDIVYIGY